MTLPGAIVERLVQFYGDPPTWHRQGEALKRRPYQALVSEFVEMGWKVEEWTEPQADVCRGFVLTRGDDLYVKVKLSLVGPYAQIGVGPQSDPHSGRFLTAESPRDGAAGRVLAAVLREGFQLLPEDLLAQRVDLWKDAPDKDLLIVLGGLCGSLYAYLYCFNPDEYEPAECFDD